MNTDLLKASISSALDVSFELPLFNAALVNLNDQDNVLRYSNFAYAIRELTRHVFARLAPDEDVRKCAWYTDQSHDLSRSITRKQRAIYATQGGLSHEFVHDSLNLDVAPVHKTLVEEINRLSKATHIEPHALSLSTARIDQYAADLLTALHHFLLSIEKCRAKVALEIDGLVDDAVVDEALRETIIEIDELASHHYVEEIYVDNYHVHHIDHQSIHIAANGTVQCELQYGSNSDLRRGDGAVLPQAFSFECELLCPVNDPRDVVASEGSLRVDVSPWTDARYGVDEAD